jgi:hypothetical protein
MQKKKKILENVKEKEKKNKKYKNLDGNSMNNWL